MLLAGASLALLLGGGPPVQEPQTSAVLALSTSMGLGHACPVTPTVAFTARHVVDPRPLDRDAPFLPAIWSDGEGREGLTTVLSADKSRDLAFLKGKFPSTYPLAKASPDVGDFLWIVGFEWGNKKGFLGPKIHRVRFLRSVARMLVMDGNPREGSSGSCILNAAGEVVGINVWGMPTDNDEKLGLGVAVWGEDFSFLEKEEEPSVPEIAVIPFQ